MNAAAWKGRRVLVTGHTGFKGGWLSLWLDALGAEVHGYALPPATVPSLFAALGLEERLKSRLGDVRDSAGMESALRDARPEVIFHLAAQPIVRDSYDDPVGTYATNVMGLVNLLEAARKTPSVKAIVVITSDKCYENREWVWPYREADPMGGFDPYSSSKGCAELVAAAYRRSFFGGGKGRHAALVATARAGNVVGGGDWARHRLVPDLVRAWTAGETAIIRNPYAVRPWQHVLEPLSGYLLLAERLLAGDTHCADAFNFGPLPGDAWPVRRVVEACAAHWGDGAGWRIEGEAEAPHEAGVLRLDSSKSAEVLGWRPRWGLERALPVSIAWHQTHQRGEGMREFSLAQIADYAPRG